MNIAFEAPLWSLWVGGVFGYLLMTVIAARIMVYLWGKPEKDSRLVPAFMGLFWPGLLPVGVGYLLLLVLTFFIMGKK